MPEISFVPETQPCNDWLYVPWGKTGEGACHHLAHHCADVAACFEVLAAQPVARARMETAAGRSLSPVDIARLAVLAFLHDAGKLHPGFQAKGWPKGVWQKSLHGHVREGAAIFTRGVEGLTIARNLHLDKLNEWGVDENILFAALAHHGRPFQMETGVEKRWRDGRKLGYDPVAASGEMGVMMGRWFAEAFAADGGTLPDKSELQHLLCGLVSLADWLGSTRSLFTFSAALDSDYMTKARAKAQEAVADIGIDAGP